MKLKEKIKYLKRNVDYVVFNSNGVILMSSDELDCVDAVELKEWMNRDVIDELQEENKVKFYI